MVTAVVVVMAAVVCIFVHVSLYILLRSIISHRDAILMPKRKPNPTLLLNLIPEPTFYLIATLARNLNVTLSLTLTLALCSDC